MKKREKMKNKEKLKKELPTDFNTAPLFYCCYISLLHKHIHTHMYQCNEHISLTTPTQTRLPAGHMTITVQR